MAKTDVIRYTTCGIHCWGQCVVKVRVRDGVIVACEPDDTINPGMAREDAHLPEETLGKGMIQCRPCAKAYALVREVYDPNRIIYPMKRVGPRGQGEFERISWQEALDTIADKMVQAKEKYGPYSIVHQPYSMFGMCSFPLAPWFGAGIAGWAAHSSDGWDEPEQWVLGKDLAKGLLTEGWFSLAQDHHNMLKSRLIVFWGVNLLTLLSGGWALTLIRAKEQGIPIICIEPRYTPSVELLADQWIPIRPTTDAAMMIAMANVWFKEDLWDKEFVDRWVEPEGLRRWRAYVLGLEDGLDKTPEWAEEICGVPAETIADFARLYVRSKPVNLNVSLSIGRQFYGENATRAAMYLQALSGNMGIPGGTAGAESGYPVGQMVGPPPLVDWQRKPGSYVPPVLMANYKWPKAVDTREKLDRGEISKEEYNSLIGNAAGNPAPNIRMVILETNNHVNSLPDVNQVVRAVQKLDFCLVFAQTTDHPSARYADILLPQMSLPFEGRNPIGFGFWGLFNIGVNYTSQFVYRQKCVDPPGEVKTNDWVWTQLAKRLGIAEQFNPRMVDVPDDQWDEAVEAVHREAYEVWAASEYIAPLNPPSWEEFQEKPVFRFEMGDAYYPFKADMERGENPFRGTESGKIEFYSELLARGSEYLATHDYPEGTGRCYGRGDLPPMAEWMAGGKDTFHSRDVEKYPLLMSSPHSLYRQHSWLFNSPLMNGDCHRHAIWISVADAGAREIRDNEMVRVFNDIGEMTIPVYVTSRVVPGTVVLFHGGWYMRGKQRSALMPEGIDIGGSPNLLIHNEDVPARGIGMFPAKGLVQIEKWKGV